MTEKSKFLPIMLVALMIIGILVIMLSFLPPLLIGLIYPDIFLKVLDIVGGVGIVVLFGILPGLIAFRKARSTFYRVSSIGKSVFPGEFFSGNPW